MTLRAAYDVSKARSGDLVTTFDDGDDFVGLYVIVTCNSQGYSVQIAHMGRCDFYYVNHDSIVYRYEDEALSD